MLQTQANSNHFVVGVGTHRTTLNRGANFGDTTVRTSIVVRVAGSPSNVAQTLRSVEDADWLVGSARDLADAMHNHEVIEDAEEFERWLSDFV